jgi:hypothetical protein
MIHRLWGNSVSASSRFLIDGTSAKGGVVSSDGTSAEGGVVNSDGTSVKGGVVSSDGTSAKGGVVNSGKRRVLPWSVACDPAKLLVEAARVHEASAQRGIEDRAPAEERQHGIADPRTVDVALRRNAVRRVKLARYRFWRDP